MKEGPSRKELAAWVRGLPANEKDDLFINFLSESSGRCRLELLQRFQRRITACIPYYRCKRYVRRAVLSLLAQTHRDLTVVVVNDGDPDPPWPMLRDITDPRLVRFNLAENRGPTL